jgi:hypothetical protein
MADEKQNKINVNIGHDTKVLYTDMIFMNVNEDGVTLDVCQKMGNSNQFQVVSRIGMSRHHAEKFVKKLSEILALTLGQTQTGEKN